MDATGDCGDVERLVNASWLNVVEIDGSMNLWTNSLTDNKRV